MHPIVEALGDPATYVDELVRSHRPRTRHPGEDAAKASAAARVVANEAARLKEDAARASDAALLVAGEVAKAQERSLSRRVTRAIGKHPVALVALIAASAAFIEFEIALGVLTGIGATALLATAGGPQTRQQLVERSKWLLQRARSTMRRAKSRVDNLASAAHAA